MQLNGRVLASGVTVPSSIPCAESKQAKADDAVLGTGVRHVLKFLREAF